MATNYDYVTRNDGTKIQVDSAKRDGDGKLISGNYGKVDGNYPTMSVGHADSANSLDTTIGNDDQTPFNYQTSGGSTDVETGMQKLDKLVGVDVVKNQLVETILDPSGTIPAGSGEYLTVATAVLNGYHKVLFFVKATVSNPDDLKVYIVAKDGSGNLEYFYGESFSNGISFGISDMQNYTDEIFIRLISNSGTETAVSDIDAKIIDLTQRYGSNDVVNAIIGNGTDAQKLVNLLKFDNDLLSDLSYDTGTLVNSKSEKLKTVRYNQLKDNLSVSGNSVIVVSKTLDNPIISTGNNLAVLAKTTALSPYVLLFDENDNEICDMFLSNSTGDGYKYGRGKYGDNDFSIPAGTKIAKIQFFYDGSGGTSGTFTYEDICLFYYWDGSKITYEPYEEHIYDLPNKDMHGVLKVSSGKVIADGDELYPDGSGKTRYGVVDLSTLNWYYNDGAKCWLADGISVKIPANNYSVPNIIHSTYERTYVAYYYGDETKTNCIGIGQSGYIQVNNGSTTTEPTGTLIYELATETNLTDQGAFASSIFADNFGTMQFLKSDNTQIDGLQGAEIFYKANVAGFAESLYVKTDGSVDNLVTQAELTIVDNKIGAKLPECPTTTDGTYVLKATVADGEVTYTWVAEV